MDDLKCATITFLTDAFDKKSEQTIEVYVPEDATEENVTADFKAAKFADEADFTSDPEAWAQFVILGVEMRPIPKPVPLPEGTEAPLHTPWHRIPIANTKYEPKVGEFFMVMTEDKGMRYVQQTEADEAAQWRERCAMVLPFSDLGNLPDGATISFEVPIPERPYPVEEGTISGRYDTEEEGAGYILSVGFAEGKWLVAFGSWVIKDLLSLPYGAREFIVS